MIALQIGCTAIVLLYLVLRLRREPDRAAFAGRFGILMASSWIAENTCIHAYGFYAYNPEWFLFIDQVPILIIAIWPVVIHSAFDLASHDKTRTTLRVALTGGLIVLTDAALIEPISVRAGLWQWFEPGLFSVPPIGILGWAFFATVAMHILHSKRRPAWMLVAAPGLTHVLLLGTWWGFFAHVNHPIDGGAAVIVGAVAAVAVIVRLLWTRHLPSPPPATILLRAPGASFFFVLLILHALDDTALTAWSLVFAVPWIVFVALGLRTTSAAQKS